MDAAEARADVDAARLYLDTLRHVISTSSFATSSPADDSRGDNDADREDAIDR